MGRRQYTPEQREQREQDDRRAAEAGETLMTDPDRVAAVVDGLVVTSTSPRLLRYSLRNLAMLHIQAAERGIPLSDVAGYREWRTRGRQVRRGEAGLRIVAFCGRDQDQEGNGDTAAVAVVGEAADAEAPRGRARFRFASVWDVSQTEPVEGAEATASPVAVDPAAEVVAGLTEQITRRGYTLTTGPGPVVDHAERAVTAPAEPGALARALADILTTTPDMADRAPDAVPAPATDPDAVPVVTAGHGRMTITPQAPRPDGSVPYRVRGTRIDGTVTIAIDDPAATPEPFSVSAHLGTGRVTDPDREGALTVNGVSLSSVMGGLFLSRVDELVTEPQWSVRLWRDGGKEVSPVTRAKTGAAVHAVITHWRGRADIPGLRAAAVRAEAARRAAESRRDQAEADARAERARAEADRQAAQARTWEAIAAGGPNAGADDPGGQLSLFG